MSSNFDLCLFYKFILYVALLFVYEIYAKLFCFRYKCETAGFRACERRAVSHTIWITA